MKRLAASAMVAALALALVPGFVEDDHNKIARLRLAPPSAWAREVHARLQVADLHADSLLWGRDLTRRGAHGHVDVPRLIQGNVALQGFSVVTKTPRGLNIERNDDRSDDVKWLALVQLWPPRTWISLKARALYLARRLRETAARSAGRLTLVRSAADLEAFLAQRRADPRRVAGILGLEGAQALEGELANLDALYDAGFRMLAPTHFFDTEMGGSAHGVKKGGLTPLGRRMLQHMEAKGMLLDLAHASEATIRDALQAARRPVVVSHTGVRGTCDNARNLSDAQLRAIAATGGVVGIGYWRTAVCGRDPRAIARAVRHAVDVAGVEHVGLGSDFDGSVETPFDTAGLVHLTDALLAEGFSEDELRAVMGGNVLRLLAQSLRPASHRAPIDRAGATPAAPAAQLRVSASRALRRT